MKIFLVGLVLLICSCRSDNEPRTVNDWPRHIDSLDRVWSDKKFDLKIYWYVRQPGDEGHESEPSPIIMDFIDSTKFLRYQIEYAPHYSYFSRVFYLNDSTLKRTSYRIASISRWKSRITADTTLRLPNGTNVSKGDSVLDLKYLEFLNAASTATFTGISYKYNNIFDVTMDSVVAESYKK